MSTSYFLSPHVHLCVAGKQIVLLDLERDKYLAVAHEHPLGRWVRGWPAVAPGPDQIEVAADAAAAGEMAARSEVPAAEFAAPVAPVGEGAENRLLSKMLAQRLLVTDPALGKIAAPIVADEVKVALVELQLHERPRATGGQFWNLFRAHALAKWSLKRRPIKEVVEAARLRKKGTSTAATLDIERVRTLVMAFFHLRPLFYTAHNACLLDSLTLTRFLALYGVFPDWVFGVKTDPFYAHCWVQQSGYVFNDSPDYVGEFAPILVV
jgi:Transglutaminase-like superfamily